MLRYFKESALFTAVCFLLGLLISWAFIPLFNSMLDTKIDLFHSIDLLWFLPLAYVIISIFAGILPAIVVSRFNPIDVVKGTIRMRSKMWFSKIFIVAQNVISITLVVMAITMMLQMKHLADYVLCRKPGKLPCKTVQESYAKEYGMDTIEIHEDAINENDVVLLHDDLLATGGTMKAACDLVKKFHPKKVYANFIIELVNENFIGRKIFDEDVEVSTLLQL